MIAVFIGNDHRKSEFVRDCAEKGEEVSAFVEVGCTSPTDKNRQQTTTTMHNQNNLTVFIVHLAIQNLDTCTSTLRLHFVLMVSSKSLQKSLFNVQDSLILRYAAHWRY